MGNTIFKLNKAGVRKGILQADYMLEFVSNEAKKKAGSNEHIKPFIGYDRAKAIIYPDRKEDKK